MTLVALVSGAGMAAMVGWGVAALVRLNRLHAAMMGVLAVVKGRNARAIKGGDLSRLASPFVYCCDLNVALKLWVPLASAFNAKTLEEFPEVLRSYGIRVL